MNYFLGRKKNKNFICVNGIFARKFIIIKRDLFSLLFFS
nr:MAG TPA: hypothetical protein [Caudoviricetes sp.]